MRGTRLIVISQVISVTFLSWLESFADHHGPVELWTGVDFVEASETIRVRRFVPYNKDSYPSRLLTWIRFSTSVMMRLMFISWRIPVLAITNPPLMPLILVLNSVLLGRRYAIMEYDIYPQIMVAMGLLTSRNPVYHVWRMWHAWALRRSKLVVALSDLMADELEGMANTKLESTVVIPTWTDTARIKPVPKAQNPFVREHLPGSEFVVLYSGNLGATHSIETILNVAEHLKLESRVQFLIIGNGAKYALVELAIASGRTPNIKLLPLQPVEVLPYSLASADIAFVTLASGYERLSLPSKTYDVMAAGCAIIGISRAGSGLDALISEHICGKHFEPDQSDKIASWIIDLYDNRDALHELQRNDRDAAVEHYSAEHCGSKLTQVILEQLCGPST